jgi:hypothetical protein
MISTWIASNICLGCSFKPQQPNYRLPLCGSVPEYGQRMKVVGTAAATDLTVVGTATTATKLHKHKNN